MRGIAKKSEPIPVIVHEPETAEGRCELAARAAGVHADAAGRCISRLNCSSQQKRQILDALIRQASEP